MFIPKRGKTCQPLPPKFCNRAVKKLERIIIIIIIIINNSNDNNSFTSRQFLRPFAARHF